MSVRHPVRVVEQPAGLSRFVSSRGCTHPARRTSSLAQIFGRLRHGRKGPCRVSPLLGDQQYDGGGEQRAHSDVEHAQGA